MDVRPVRLLRLSVLVMPDIPRVVDRDRLRPIVFAPLSTAITARLSTVPGPCIHRHPRDSANPCL